MGSGGGDKYSKRDHVNANDYILHEQLYKHLSYLDPTKFKTIAEKGLEDGALEGIIKLFPQISKRQVKLELFSFASKFVVLKLLLANDDNKDSSCNYCKICSTSPSCVLKILASSRLHDKAYDNLYEPYKVICTLSVTKVQCPSPKSNDHKNKVKKYRCLRRTWNYTCCYTLKRICFMNWMQKELLIDSHNHLVNSNDCPFMPPWGSG